MSSAVYLLGTEGEQNLSVYNSGASLEDISNDLTRIIEENLLVIESFMVSTTRGDYFYESLESLLVDIAEWSNS